MCVHKTEAKLRVKRIVIRRNWRQLYNVVIEYTIYTHYTIYIKEYDVEKIANNEKAYPGVNNMVQ